MWGYHCSLLDFAILLPIWRLPSFHTNLLPRSLTPCLVTTHQMMSWPITQHERIHRLLFFLRQQSISAIVCNLTVRYIAAVQTFFFQEHIILCINACMALDWWPNVTTFCHSKLAQASHREILTTRCFRIYKCECSWNITIHKLHDWTIHKSILTIVTC